MKLQIVKFQEGAADGGNWTPYAIENDKAEFMVIHDGYGLKVGSYVSFETMALDPGVRHCVLSTKNRCDDIISFLKNSNVRFRYTVVESVSA